MFRVVLHTSPPWVNNAFSVFSLCSCSGQGMVGPFPGEPHWRAVAWVEYSEALNADDRQCWGLLDLETPTARDLEVTHMHTGVGTQWSPKWGAGLGRGVMQIRGHSDFSLILFSNSATRSSESLLITHKAWFMSSEGIFPFSFLLSICMSSE